MALDPNIILSYKAPEIQNPMDIAAKNLTMRQLSGQVQQQDQSMASDQALKNAFASGTTTNPDGSIKFNQQAILGQAAQSGKVAPDKIMSLQELFGHNDLNQMKLLAQKSMTLANSATPQNWAQVRAAAIASSPDPKQAEANFPPDFRPEFVENVWKPRIISMGQTVEEQAQQMNKDREFGLKGKELGISQQKADAETKKANAAAQNANTNEKVRGSNEYSKTTMLLNGSRVPKDVALAKVDAYNTDKANEMLKDFPDINKMDSTMAHTYLGEIAKIAQGGAPTIEALKGLDPGTLPEKASHAWQTVIGSPTPANLGAFLSEMRNYASRVGDGAKQTVLKYNQGVLDTRQDFHSDRQKELLKKSFIDPFTKPGQQALDPKVSDYAKTHNLDYSTATSILKARGYNGG